MVRSSGSCSSRSRCIGIERGEVVEEDLLARLIGGLEVDGLDLEQGEVALGVLGRTHLAGDGVAGAQVEAPDLGGRDVDVVGPGQVVVVGRAQEAEPVGQHFQHALGEDQAVFLGLGLEDLEDQLLLAQPAVVLDAEVAGDVVQLGNGLLLQLGEIHSVSGLGVGGRAGLASFSAGAHQQAPGAAGRRRTAKVM